jgi:hypothetical protein
MTYPINLTQEENINNTDYIRINIDINIDRNNPAPLIDVKKSLESLFAEINKVFC